MAGYRLILAEDNPDHQYLLRRSLQRADPAVQVHVVATGADLLAEARKRSCDCILIDYNLPDAEADTLIQQLAQLPCASPMIVLSSSQEQKVVVRSVRSGCTDFVPKSEAMRGTQLWERVRAAIERHRQERNERRRMERRVEHLAQLALSDPLTELPNRLALETMWHGRRRRSDRRGRTVCAMLDLDHFKAINDQYGHLAGDQALKDFARLLRHHTGPHDLVCRWGGEEFLVMLAESDPVVGMLWAERLRKQAAAEPHSHDGRTFHFTVSIGLACSGESSPARLLQEADEALYLAKRRGRNQTTTYEMVRLDRIAGELAADPALTPEARLRQLLDRAGQLLGPTQRHHLTYHAQRVTEISLFLCSFLELDGEVTERVRLAARYHDLGKLAMPEGLLAKAGRLERQERQIMRRHADEGADLAARLGVDPRVVQAIRYHHVWYDGTFMPAGERNPDVPLEAMIIGVADALDAMTSERSYRPARALSAAIDELRRCSGTQFSPEVVESASRLLTGARLAEASCSS